MEKSRLAGETEILSTEADVRGTNYVGKRPLEGGHPVARARIRTCSRRRTRTPLFEALTERLDKILSRYPNRQAALLPTLNLAQEIRGYISPETMEEVARELGLSPAYVRGVATFYTMYNKAPVGRYLVQVCTNVCCNLCGADDVVRAFLEATGTEPGETSEDGMFTVVEAECLGACGFPTVVQINERYFENVVPEDVAILERLRSEAAASKNGASAPRPGRR